MARSIRKILLGLLVWSSTGNAEPMSAQAASGLLTLEEVGVRATFGLRRSESWLADLAKPLDARFSGSSVVILDAAPPWIRVFDRQGNFVRALSTMGDGPGETRRPFSLAGARDGAVILAHVNGIEFFDIQGTHTFSIRGVRAWGAVEACGALLTLIEDAAAPPQASLVRMTLQGAVSDTLMRVAPARGRSRNYHPWFIQYTTNGVFVYPEEALRNRLVEIGCDGRIRREIPVPELGRGDSVVVQGGLIGMFSPRPPHPAGLGRVENRLLWAVRALNRSAGNAVDSVTVITALDQAGRARQVSIRGWYQLFDSGTDGALLLGNSWTDDQNWEYGATWGLIPGVFLVDGHALLRIIDTRGTTPRPP